MLHEFFKLDLQVDKKKKLFWKVCYLISIKEQVVCKVLCGCKNIFEIQKVFIHAQFLHDPSSSSSFTQATFMVRLPALGLAVYHLYQSADSPLTLRSDTLVRLPGSSNTARSGDPLPVRSQLSDPQTFYISSQSLTLGFSGSTGLLEVCPLTPSLFICLT